MTTTAVRTIVVGAGHNGLAVSRLLAHARHEHVVLESAEVGHRWTTQRWDSLRLLTPNWLNALPGSPYRGNDPDEYLTAAAFRQLLAAYATGFEAPVHAGVDVQRVTLTDAGYAVSTGSGRWTAQNVVLASGAHARAHVPALLAAATVPVVPATSYRNPDRLPPGAVLVLGASASGAQIAHELATSGRRVVLAVGRHARMPRRYRGMDVFWWLHRTGRLSRTIDSMPDPRLARREPSLQVVGRGPQGETPSTHCADLDLASLQAIGVRLAGRLVGLDDGVARFADDLEASVTHADERMHRFLDVVDRYIDRTGSAGRLPAGHRPPPIAAGPGPRSIRLADDGISVIVLATGMRPDHSYLRVPVLDDEGYVVQRRGVTAAAGLYVVGQPFQHRRDATFIGGAGHAARDVVTHLLTGSLPAADDGHSWPSPEPVGTVRSRASVAAR